jgi:hypothetical protein
MGAHARPVDRESAHCISRARLTLERSSHTTAFEMAEFQPVRISEIDRISQGLGTLRQSSRRSGRR